MRNAQRRLNEAEARLGSVNNPLYTERYWITLHMSHGPNAGKDHQAVTITDTETGTTFPAEGEWLDYFHEVMNDRSEPKEIVVSWGGEEHA